MGLCSPSSSVFRHPKADAPVQNSVSVLAPLAILHVVAALNRFSPAASPPSFPCWSSSGCPRARTGPWPFALRKTLRLGCSFFGRITICA